MSYISSLHDTMSSHSVNNTHSRQWSRSSTSHSYRVEKPRSCHNSPMANERRKTTTGAKLYATLDDHFRMMMGIPADQQFPEPAQLQQLHQQPRPVSWHPSSTHFTVQPQVQDYYSSPEESSAPSDFYSLSARNSSYIEPTYSAYPNYQSEQSPQDNYQTQSFDMSSYSTPATEPMPWYLQEWARKNQEQTMQPQSSSIDCLPLQHPEPEQEADEEMEDSGKELIGMGLYDVPDPTEGWGSLVESTGKGLKLEETWTPPEEEEEEEEDADEEEQEEQEEDDVSSEEGEDELPPPPAPEPQHFQVPVMKTQVPTNMTGQSFFFEEDDSVTKEWWFHQLHQPSMPVRDAGIGYGWL